MSRETIRNKVFQIKTRNEFRETCLEVFRYQHKFNTIYGKFCDLLGVKPESVSEVHEIPFLPIEFFKQHKVVAGDIQQEYKVFESSGTTGISASRHFISDINVYRESFYNCFSLFFGNPAKYVHLALLPSYLERANSSLIYMVGYFIDRSIKQGSGFYLYDHDALLQRVDDLRNQGGKVILWGVTFALLDLADKESPDLNDVIVIETGGMKGRRKEITRDELHKILRDSFNIKRVHSEYGMTELLSQAYSKGDGAFETPPWMKVFIRDINDPMAYLDPGRTGGINIIDLANFDSCSFISTQDLGRIDYEGKFEVMGRFDNSDVRGCNLMI